jgi:hypothetical protein
MTQQFKFGSEFQFYAKKNRKLTVAIPITRKTWEGWKPRLGASEEENLIMGLAGQLIRLFFRGLLSI